MLPRAMRVLRPTSSNEDQAEAQGIQVKKGLFP